MCSGGLKINIYVLFQSYGGELSSFIVSVILSFSFFHSVFNIYVESDSTNYNM